MQVLRTHFPDAIIKNDVQEVEALPKVRGNQRIFLHGDDAPHERNCIVRLIFAYGVNSF